MLRATTACNCSSLIWLDGSAPAALASLLFDPPEPQSIVKTQLCYPFAHLHLLSSDSFFSLIFSLLLFSSLTLPTSAFPSVHIVGSLTSKLPSMIMSPFSVACENQAVVITSFLRGSVEFLSMLDKWRCKSSQGTGSSFFHQLPSQKNTHDSKPDCQMCFCFGPLSLGQACSTNHLHWS